MLVVPVIEGAAAGARGVSAAADMGSDGAAHIVGDCESQLDAPNGLVPVPSSETSSAPNDSIAPYAPLPSKSGRGSIGPLLLSAAKFRSSVIEVPQAAITWR